MDNKIMISLKKSPIGCRNSHRLILKSLGLRKLNQEIVLDRNAANLGKINKIAYLLEIKQSW